MLNKVNNKKFNSINFDVNLSTAQGISDGQIAVRIVPRGIEENSLATWESGGITNKDDSSSHNSIGTIYELRIQNLTKDIISDWNCRIYFPENVFFNAGWNGDFNFHQNVNNNEKNCTFRNELGILNDTGITTYYSMGALYIPFFKGDYVDYVPSVKSAEVPVEPSVDSSNNNFSEKLIGLILYTEDVPKDYVLTFSQGIINYRIQKKLANEWGMVIAIILLWIWFCTAIVMLAIHIKSVRYKKENLKKEKMLEVLKFDELTGVYTRQAFYHYVKEIYQKEINKEYCFIAIDMENFKFANNQYGDKVCDDFLSFVGQKLKTNISEGIHGRFGGDQFMIFSEKAKFKDENQIYSELKSIIEKSPLPNMVFKMGIYIPSDRETPVNRCCDRAFIALKKIKGLYDQNIFIYDSKLDNKMDTEQKIYECRETALVEKQFSVYYQPKHDSFSHQLIGAEALVRWIHPDFGFMSPGDFIPMFEKTGFITKLDSYIFTNVLADLKKWIDEGRNVVPVSINISRKDFYQENWFEDQLKLVDEYGINHNLIHLEVTESLYTGDVGIIKEKIKLAQEKGFLIEMDDFGAGYSSLGSMATFPLDVLKLDISFVRNIDVTEIMVESIISNAHRMGLKTIAEGVETEKQLSIMQKLNCDFIQGFYFSKPLPEEKFEEYIQKKYEIENSISVKNTHWSEITQDIEIKNALLNCLKILLLDDNSQSRIKELLSVIGRFYGADRSYIFEVKHSDLYRNFRCEWCNNGISSHEVLFSAEENSDLSIPKGIKDNLNENNNSQHMMDLGDNEAWLENYDKNGDFYLPEIEIVKDKNPGMYIALKSLEISSFISTLIKDNEEIIAIIGVENPTVHTDSNELIHSITPFVINEFKKKKE